MNTNWEVKTLGQVCKKITDGSHFSPKSDEIGEYPYVTVRDIDQDLINFKTCKFIDEDNYKNLVKNGCQPVKGDLLFSKDGTVGKVSLVNFEKDFVVLSSLAIIRPNQYIISPELLKYILKSPLFFQESLGKKTGAAIRRIILNNLKQIEITFPKSLDEQKRIVAILDKAFATIDKAKANAETNLRNARALFKSYLQSVFANPGEGWEEKSLGTEIDLLCGFAFKSNRYTESPDDIRLLRGDNIMQGTLRWDDVKRWPSGEAGEYNRYQLKEGDIVLAMDRPWVKAGLKYSSITNEDLPSLLVQRTARLRVNATLDKRFLTYLLGSRDFTHHIIGVQSGIGVPHISAQQIKDFEFLKPPLSEQKAIVAKLDALSVETKRLEAIYQQKLVDLAELKKAILQKAFQGELTTTPESALAETVA